jgi:hypothetical protein
MMFINARPARVSGVNAYASDIAQWSLCVIILLFVCFPAFGSAAASSAHDEAVPSSDPTVSIAADTNDAPAPKSYEIGGQITILPQGLFGFHSPYAGPHSLQSVAEIRTTDTYTLYLGDRINKHLEVYLDPEMTLGSGLSDGVGLAGFTNGEVVRNPNLSKSPYLARYFLRWIVPTGKGEDSIEPGENQIAGKYPSNRLAVTAGKLADTDIFDRNSYANSTRTQFMNWAFINNNAYDYAADTRGYTEGVALEWVHPNHVLRLGSFQMPTVANGIDLAGNLSENMGDQIEYEIHPQLLKKQSAAIVRLLGYRNMAHMGNYRDALALAKQTGTTPDIISVEREGAVKYGFGLNFEQPLADGGDTGIFGRFGWDDGATESFAYTEADRSISLGSQISGARWHRPKDRLGIALAANGLSDAHKDYLAAGGLGFQLGDGKLDYGWETIFETYYSYQISKPLAVSLDYQFIVNPGYNKDRGPVNVPSIRLHLEY